MHARRPRKRFGQHFLHDQNVLEKIVSVVAPRIHDHFVEIGPGEGVLTDLLLSIPITLDAIEIDRDLVNELKIRYAAYTQFHLHQYDVLDFDFLTLKNSEKKLRIIGNLPYNISTPLLFKLFSVQEIIEDMHFMLQKEVVLRLTAKHNDHLYGRLSVMAQYFCETRELFEVSPASFSPPPKVESAFVQLIPRTHLLPLNNFETFSNVVKEAFNYRRKTLGNSLKRLITAHQLQALNIDASQRPQELSIANFVTIANYLSE